MANFPHIDPVEAAVSEDAIAAFEQRIGVPLPDDYRSFMLAHNGGKPSRKAFVYKDFSGPYTDSAVRYFFAFTSNQDKSIRGNYGIYVGGSRVPRDLVPIATDEGGNLVCIAVKGPNVGKIYFWDHEEEAEEGQQASYDNLYLVADSFNEFLENLR